MNTKALEAALKQCSLHELELILHRILVRSGFGDVQVLDRRENRQKSRHGGFEMACEGTFGTLRVRMLVKIVNDSVHQRMLSEMAGTLVRHKADTGLIVATGNATAFMRSLLPAYLPVARIEVIDGKDLARLMVEHRVGVRGETDVDYAFFGELERLSFRFLSFLADIK